MIENKFGENINMSTKYNYDCWDKIFMDKLGRFTFRLKPNVRMGPWGNEDYLPELRKAIEAGLVENLVRIDDIYSENMKDFE